MIIGAINGVGPWLEWVGTLAESPDYQHVFLSWVSARRPEEWAKFAAAKGRAPDDPYLVLDAHLACQAAVIEATRLLLDKAYAVLEAKQALGELPPGGV